MRKESSFSAVWILLFGAMLALPTLAVLHLLSEYSNWHVSGYIFTVSMVTYLLYRADKTRAESGSWRISERTLHFFELAGGWLVAFWAQRILRHKIRKTSYQISFWLIVLLHQYLAIDYLNSWQYSSELLAFAKKVYAQILPHL